jgi:hypothetical protein
MNSNEKESFTFYIDRKVTIWIRETHEVEAETYEEAEKQMIESFKEDTECDETFVEQETLYDTIEKLEPGDNDGSPTVELYSDERHEVLIDNV